MSLLFVVWRTIVWVLGLLSARLNLNPDNAYPWIPDTPWEPALPAWLSFFARWDSGFYYGIAESGYWLTADGTTNTTFFPLYPLLMKGLGTLIGDHYLVAGIILSLVFTWLACYVFYKLAKLEYKKSSTALRSVLYFLIFPTAVFLAAIYTESLFVLLLLSSIYLARRNKWLGASLVALLLTATRPVGIIIIPVLFLEYLEQRHFKWKEVKADILWLLLVPLGLISYMSYLWYKFSDPFLFLTSQQNWSRATSPSIFTPFTTLGSYLHDFFLYQGGNLRYWIVNASDLLFFVFGITMSILVFIKLRKSYGLLVFLGSVIPLLTGTLISVSRFILVLFPIYLLFAKWGERQIINYIIILIFVPLFILFTILFTSWYWVA